MIAASLYPSLELSSSEVWVEEQFSKNAFIFLGAILYAKYRQRNTNIKNTKKTMTFKKILRGRLQRRRYHFQEKNQVYICNYIYINYLLFSEHFSNIWIKFAIF